MFRTDLLSIVSSLNTAYTAIDICNAIYVGCLLARSETDLASRQPTELALQTPTAVYAVLRLLTVDSRSVRNM